MINLYDAKKLVIRKSLHILIVFTPALAAFSYPLAVLLLSSGIVFFAFVESLRFHTRPPVWKPAVCIAQITLFASHRRDKDRFVLGPITLGAGALCVLLCFDPHTAALGIYALAAGDSLAGLAGRLFGRCRPRILCGKSLEGSLACFFVIAGITGLVTGSWKEALVAALAGTTAEALPIEDFDNILLPFSVSAVLTLFNHA
ncbi:MAG: phosphatidate cytidylyltransferase [Spirochaetaceae bacterium]|jgi:dolichol kinase|nr:phosphatidate cytidylyltransferase [Spirochaetaceae bacterium]